MWRGARKRSAGSRRNRIDTNPPDLELGFDVVKVQDADLNQMKRAISDFGTKLANAGGSAVGLLYYAGHGIQVGGTNFLIPLKANIVKAADEAADAGRILKQMEFAGNALNVIILDACRNNPLSRDMFSGWKVVDCDPKRRGRIPHGLPCRGRAVGNEKPRASRRGVSLPSHVMGIRSPSGSSRPAAASAGRRSWSRRPGRP